MVLSTDLGMGFSNLTWSWVEMCGPGGLVPWYPSKHDIGACFQHIFLQVPIDVVFAILSAYYYGARSQTRSNVQYQKWTIRARVLICILISLIPLSKGIVGMTYVEGMFRPVDYLTSGVAIVAWFIHTGYVHSLRHRPNVHGPVLVRVVWTLTAVLSIINLRSLILAKNDLPSTISFGFGITMVVLQCLYGITLCTICFKRTNEGNSSQVQYSERSSLLGSSYQGFREDVDSEYLGVAMEHASFISKLIFYWVYPLLSRGGKEKLSNPDDVFDLPCELNCSNLCVQLHTILNGSQPGLPTRSPARTVRISLLRALHKCFGVEFYCVGILKFLADVSTFCGPVLLNLLIQFIEEPTEDFSQGYQLAAGLFLATFFGAICNVHFTFLVSKVGMKLRGAIIATVYRKTLNIPYSTINSFSVGEIVNFMSIDTERVVNSCPSFHTFWSIPFQIMVSFYLLYRQVGISFLAGVAFTLVLIPINKVIANKIQDLSTKMMTAKDERVSIMSDVLHGIRVLKLHVWEKYFLEKVLRTRTTELKYLRGRKYLDALCVYFWASTPVLVTILTLGTYVLLGNRLTAATVFTTLALLNMLIGPLNSFPWVLNGLMEAWVSVRRIQRLLDVSSMELNDYYRPDHFSKILLENCCVEWEPSRSEEDASYAPNGLRDIDFEASRGQLIAVIGSVGSGKTTLLHALMGEVCKTNGDVSVFDWVGGFGLVAQTPWLQRGTIRENILFGKSYDSGRFKAVLDGCCLTEDLTVLHGGELAIVGEGGTTLSGGQRARVALARAVYQDKDIYLLDDILAALDPPVARHVYNKVVCGILKDKTRILCTNNTQLITNADLVIQLDQGKFVQSGHPSEILLNYDNFSSMDTESMSSFKESREESEPSQPNDEEISETGAVKASVFATYASSAGVFLTFAIVVSLFLMQTSRNASDFWLSVWVSSSNSTLDTDPYSKYLYIYLFLALSNTFFTLFRAFLFAYGGVVAAQVIHEKLLSKVLHSKLTFFDISPIGRILNRFSSDTYTVDDSLPFITNILFAQIFGLVGALSITLYGLPWLFLVIAPLVPMYHYLQTTYRKCSRELKRLTSVTLSPLYSHFNETLQGIVTIRAFRSLSNFQLRNEEHLENNQRASFASLAIRSWLGFRLEMMGVVLVTGVAMVAVVQHQFDVVEPAIVGLTVAYALSITGLLSGVISAFVETEREFVALERVVQYLDQIEAEEEYGSKPLSAWPSQGVISFQSVYLKYRDHLAPSLNGISFQTRPFEKIGVVGRTGAGKSSLIAALLRLVQVSSGCITVDSVNINHILIQCVRSRIAVIPQDAYLFKGTIRLNLDPLSEFTDLLIWNTLEICKIRQLIEDHGGLESSVDIGGRNFSQGQRQLLCLARAAIRNTKIVCIDEATASVDQETDQLIQRTIRSCFRESTVLTIAHRLSTVMDSDRLLVLRNGEVVEFDTPDNLASDPTSYFYKLSQRNKLQ